MSNALSWFEIPVRDLAASQKFYEAVLGRAMHREEIGGHALAVFPYAPPAGVGGCLLAGSDTPSPSADGTRVYLDAGPDLDPILARVSPAGGRVVVGKTALPPGMGVFAHIADVEGNVVGLHAAG